MSLKKLPLVRFEILGFFVNILTPDDEYSGENREHFLGQIQMIVSQKLGIFSQFFIAFLKSSSISQYLEKKGESHSLSFSKITDSETGRYLDA